MKKAIVLGATGMVGTQLIRLLLANDEYSEIVTLVRNPCGFKHPKLNEHIVNFDQPETWSKFIKGDVLFSALGTTIAQAKTKKAQYKVDYTYQYSVAEIAANNEVTSYVLISSAGANAMSKIFYTSMKGQLEDAIQFLPFEYISILRPGQLAGNRTENRLGEKVGLTMMYTLNKLGLFKKYRPIQAKQVAQAMLQAAEKKESATYTLNEIFDLAE